MGFSELPREEVIQIAKLARLQLTNDQVADYQDQLSTIVDYFKQLEAIDTTNVPVTSQVTGLSTVLADDQVASGADVDELLAGAPDRDGTALKVRAVFARLSNSDSNRTGGAA